ncbi:hypothetical protein [Hymenobacter koreensis]|uniref:Uncharacterized protein n=1 Tax=Hymenobacter koreensis TaxID=1084523 RepID=A0ABP8JNK2_9BACT
MATWKKILVGFLLACVVSICFSFLTGCRSTRPEPEAATAQPAPRTRTAPDVPANVTANVPEGQAGVRVNPLPVLPSNPTRRQYKAHKRQLDAWEAAEVAYAKSVAGPRKLGKGSLYAPNASAPVQNTYKPDAPTTQAEAGAQVQVAASKTGIAQAGEGNTATQTKPSAWPSPWWLLLLLIPVYVYRKRLPVVGGLFA